MSYERQILKIAELIIDEDNLLEFYLLFTRETNTNYATWDSMFMFNGVQIESTPTTGANRYCDINGNRYEGRLLTTNIAVRNAYHMGEIQQIQ